jgi:hypothetical protein
MIRKTKSDPTGQRDNRKAGRVKIKNRLIRAKKKVIAYFLALPSESKRELVVVNASKVVYEYGLTDVKMEQIERDIKAIFRLELTDTTGDTMPDYWYRKLEAELSYRQGATEQVVEFNRLMIQSVLLGLKDRSRAFKIESGQFLQSMDYIGNIKKKFVTIFSEMKTFADKVSTQISRKIIDGMKVGLRPAEIIDSINERSDVAISSSETLIDTQTNEAYNDGKTDTIISLSNQTGLDVYVQHISALLPTTRDDHAARHLKFYTVNQQNKWWNEGANRINCHCTIKPALLDSHGNPYDAFAGK